MYNQEEFKRQYSHFEQWCKDEGYNDIEDLQRNCSKRSIADDLYFFRIIRNLITHNPKAKDRLTLTESFKNDFEKLCESFMATMSDIAVPYKDIFKREMSDKVIPTISVMKNRSFSHVPVMNGKKVWGVFSESAIFNIVGDGGTSIIEDDTPLYEIAKYITEYSKTGVFDFVGRTASIDDIRRMFAESFENGRRLDVIYITTTGDRNGDLVGLVTIWDLSKL